MRYLIVFIVIALSSQPSFAFEQGNGIYTITLSDIEQEVAKAIQTQNITELATAKAEGVQRNAAYGHSTPLAIQIKALKADTISKRWSANINFLSNNEIVSVIPMRGMFTEMLMLPTSVNLIPRGKEIGETDIEMRPYPLSYAHKSVIRKKSDLLGKVPHRPISANRPLRAEEFTTPNVVRKNSSVTLQFKTSAIDITTSGQAMENGSVGDVIQVLNINSKKVVRATIVDKDTVRVGANIQTSALERNSLEALYAQ